MAEHNTGMDYPEHERTYALFITMTKWGIYSVAAILVLMALFLV